MALARSKLTAQGQVSVPAEVRRRLGLVGGSSIEWEEEDGKIVVRRAGKSTLADVHRAFFPDGPPARKTIAEMKEGIRQYVREKYARR